MASPRQPFTKYGLTWLPNTSPLDIEFEIIAQIDEWRKQNGLTLFDHYREAQRLLWPDHDHHRWTDLALRTMVENDVSILMGASDSSKTFSMAKFVLTDWWARPDKALWLVSSTELRGAELRIWGVMKDLFNQARERHRQLPGTVLETIHSITMEATCTDNSEGRSLTTGCVFVPCKRGNTWIGIGGLTGMKPKPGGRLGHAGDECFVAGTMVDTPTGPRAIETIRAGDRVVCAAGTRQVLGTMSRMTKRLVRVRAKDGREFICTPEHRVFTTKGWKKAIDLNQGDAMVSVYEAMQSLWQNHAPSTQQSEVLFNGLPNEISNSAMHQLRKEFSSFFESKTISVQTARENAGVLFAKLCGDMAAESAGLPGQVFHANAVSENVQRDEGLYRISSRVERATVGEVAGSNGKKNTGRKGRLEEEAVENSQGERICSKDSRRKWNWSDSRRSSVNEVVSVRQMELRNQDRQVEWQRIPATVQSGFGISRFEVGGRSRRLFSRIIWPERKGCKKDSVLGGSRVDSVTILESSDIGYAWDREGRVRVYNLAVEGHPSYSVNGFLVHNCSAMAPVFLDAYANWVGKENFKGIMSGNPFDIDDTLCRAAEPLEGWDSWHDTGKTQVWRSKFYNAQVVAFDGRDSPNFDYPPDQPTRYKYLIGRKKIEAVGRTHGKDSWQWFMQCVGKPRPGAVARRVVTRAMCETYHAFTEVTWLGEPTTKIGFCDAAYGGMGGDRCIAGYIEFGKDVNGHVVIACHPFVLVPVKVNRFVLPEDQIANFVRDYMQSVNVPPENFFFDGRGSLAVAFARLWSPKVEAVEFGGRATERPVSNDTFMWDGDKKTRRLQRCDELYSRFVTELWFAVHMVIISDQMRQLPQDVSAELCRREWDYVQNAKIEVETKAEMKERTGESPDLADGLVTAIEGARRRGFQIARLPGKEEEFEDNAWKHDLRLQAQKLRRSYTLAHTN